MSVRLPLAVTVSLVAVSLLGVSVARADSSACSSGYVKKSPDEQIALYTICLTHGQVSRDHIAWAFHNRGVAYWQKGDTVHALADLNSSLEYDPKFGLAYFNRAFIEMNGGDFDAAEADFSATIKRDPVRVRARAYAYRGLIRMYRRSCAEASPDFEMALKMDRKLAWAYSAKAWLLATCVDGGQRNGVEAVKLAQRALALEDHWRVHDVLAAAYAELGRFDDSVRELKLARERLEPGAAANQWLAPIQARLALYEASQPYREEPAKATANGDWQASLFD
jgi:tetratricopeptide (TPR) repeat protein